MVLCVQCDAILALLLTECHLLTKEQSVKQLLWDTQLVKSAESMMAAANLVSASSRYPDQHSSDNLG